jgi:hypothetical protein
MRRDENAHTRWTVVSRNDVIIRGKPGVSGRFDRCIATGSWRDNVYHVSPEDQIDAPLLHLQTPSPVCTFSALVGQIAKQTTVDMAEESDHTI